MKSKFDPKNLLKMKNKYFCNFQKVFYSSSAPLNFFYDLSPNRSLLRIKGEDTAKFLQSIYSQDVRYLFKEELEKEKDSIKSLHLRDFDGEKKNGIYGCFLNSKSRLLFEAFLIKEENEETKSVKMEIDKTLLDPIKKYLSFHKLRSKIQIEDLQEEENQMVEEEKEICFSLVSNSPSHLDRLKKERGMVMIKDDRIDHCYRIYSNKKKLREFDFLTESRIENYDLIRRWNGVSENQKELSFEENLPFQFNFDLFDALSIKKGCYVGQELVARTLFNGEIRKRVFPVFLKSHENQSFPLPLTNNNPLLASGFHHTPSSSLLNNPFEGLSFDLNSLDGKKVGKVFQNDSLPIQLALVSLQYLDQPLFKAVQGETQIYAQILNKSFLN